MTKQPSQFSRFVDIIKALRDPQRGCPWDLEQTHQTLKPYLLEETYEVLEAIDNADAKELRAELGDVLLQVVLHAQLANEKGKFSIDDVVAGISEKMIRRHPHVFGESQVENSQEVLRNWEEIKQIERKGTDGSHASLLAGVPVSLPALLRAQRLGEKASRANFDWKTVSGVWAKVEEEFSELYSEIKELFSNNNSCSSLTSASSPTISPEHRARLEHELGDILFSLCQLSRFLGLSAEDSLRSCCQRFLTRFHEMERTADKPLKNCTEDELEELWNRAKKAGYI